MQLLKTNFYPLLVLTLALIGVTANPALSHAGVINSLLKIANKVDVDVPNPGKLDIKLPGGEVPLVGKVTTDADGTWIIRTPDEKVFTADSIAAPYNRARVLASGLSC